MERSTIGKHRGKTLPQILCNDPDWFFWAMENNVFQNKGALQSEAEYLNHKARNIKIPNNDDGALVVEDVVHQPTGKFSRLDVVSANRPYEGSSSTRRSTVIDMSLPRQMADFDKLGYKNLLSSLRFYIFGSESARLTKKKCEEFFSDPNNFA
jgi:hypothetical protein